LIISLVQMYIIIFISFIFIINIIGFFSFILFLFAMNGMCLAVSLRSEKKLGLFRDKMYMEGFIVRAFVIIVSDVFGLMFDGLLCFFSIYTRQGLMRMMCCEGLLMLKINLKYFWIVTFLIWFMYYSWILNYFI
jgi:hypothetical protein